MLVVGLITVTAPQPRTDRHRLAGVVTVDGLPARRTVLVMNREKMTMYAATSSDETTGKWEIYGLPEYLEKSLFVVALDNTETYNAEVADYVSQVTGAEV